MCQHLHTETTARLLNLATAEEPNDYDDPQEYCVDCGALVTTPVAIAAPVIEFSDILI